MADRARQRADFIPHLPDLIVSLAGCRRAIRDAQTEADPFGRSFAALEEAGAALDTLGPNHPPPTRVLAPAGPPAAPPLSLS